MCLCSVEYSVSQSDVHALRTPLNVAKFGHENLARRVLKRLGLLDLLKTATDTQKACQTAIDILNDLLLCDKIASGLMTLEKRPFHLQVLFVRGSYCEAHLTYCITIPRISSGQGDHRAVFSSVRLRVDPYKIAQVIRNLLSNALKLTNPDRVRTAALVRRKTAGAALTYSTQTWSRRVVRRRGVCQPPRSLSCLWRIELLGDNCA